MMKYLLGLCVFLTGSVLLAQQQPSLLEKYLYSGDYANGQLELERAVRKNPTDELRFGLGFIRLVRTMERVGKGLYHLGLKKQQSSPMPIRIPIPENPDPAPVRYEDLRTMFAILYRDLEDVESAFASIKGDDLKVPIAMAKIKLDLTGGGKAEYDLLSIFVADFRTDMAKQLEKNPDFKICWDSADVAWFRGYCHLIMSFLDAALALDWEAEFNDHGSKAFAKPIRSKVARENGSWKIRIREPLRLSQFRTHLIAVCQLNHQVWKLIRAEKDDDHEWLPSPKQNSVLGLPVRDEMIDGWLTVMTEFEGLLDGSKVFKYREEDETGYNLKELLENPPTILDLFEILQERKYMTKGTALDTGKFLRALSIFERAGNYAYLPWFN